MTSSRARTKRPRVRRRFRTAHLPDLPAVEELLTEGAAWAKARGVVGFWPVPFPRERILPSLRRGETVVLEEDGELVGTLALSREDPDYWGVQPPVAGYVHRVAVRADRRGAGLGQTMLAWAATRVRRWGRPLLRLDTLASATPLVRYYERLGFRAVGRIWKRVAGGDRRLVLLEKRVGPGRTTRGGARVRRSRARRASPGGSARSRSSARTSRATAAPPSSRSSASARSPSATRRSGSAGR